VLSGVTETTYHFFVLELFGAMHLFFFKSKIYKHWVFFVCAVLLLSLTNVLRVIIDDSCNCTFSDVTDQRKIQHVSFIRYENDTMVCNDLTFNTYSKIPPSYNVSSKAHRQAPMNALLYSYSHWHSSPKLPRALTPCEHKTLMKLIAAFDLICQKHKIPYFMTGGTLYGSYTHHDIVPWDDDLDVLISIKYERVIHNGLLDEFYYNPNGIFCYIHKRASQMRNFYKIYFKSKSYSPLPWGFPFVDVMFFDENQTHIWTKNADKCAMKKSVVYPLTLRPLGEVWLQSPRFPHEFFKRCYLRTYSKKTQCFNIGYSHKYERREKFIEVDCKDLTNVYPFVRRNCIKGVCTEDLMMNNTLLQTITFT
jgi:hypothetical protein